MATTHALPGARFVDPQVLARIGNLDLLARNVVNGFINGLHRAPYFGASIDFAEHRGYVPGDDIRRVDWRLYARTDRYYVKQYEADTNTNFSVLLDVSRSMAFASRGVSKLEYSCYLSACLAYLAHRQRVRVRGSRERRADSRGAGVAGGPVPHDDPRAHHRARHEVLGAPDRLHRAEHGGAAGPRALQLSLEPRENDARPMTRIPNPESLMRIPNP